MLIALNKPYDVLSQFTREEPHHRVLAEFRLPERVYAIGRLDRDSEGLLLLSDEADLNKRLLHPRQGHPREYWAQVEGQVTAEALEDLRRGVPVQGKKTRPCEARELPGEKAARLWERDPPIRFRKSVPTSWVSLTLTEGRNRQVRRMTAAVGFPTLRLVRMRIGQFELGDLKPGEWRELGGGERQLVLRG